MVINGRFFYWLILLGLVAWIPAFIFLFVLDLSAIESAVSFESWVVILGLSSIAYLVVAMEMRRRYGFMVAYIAVVFSPLAISYWVCRSKILESDASDA